MGPQIHALHRVQPVGLLAVLVASVLLPSCEFIHWENKQVRAKAGLQYLVAVVEDHQKRNGTLPTLEQLTAAVSERAMIDPWGRRFVYEKLSTADGERYVLVCLGADGKLDVGDVRDYLIASREVVNGKPDRDIVAVDGDYVKNAGE